MKITYTFRGGFLPIHVVAYINGLVYHLVHIMFFLINLALVYNFLL